MPEDKQTSLFKTFIGIFLISSGLIILVWVAVTEFNSYSASNESAEPISRQNQDIKPFGKGVFPEFIKEATLDTRKAYRFASNEKNQPALEASTCYCACGHKSLLGCFISKRKPNGKIVYAEHGSGCRLCVDEVLSAKKWAGKGKSAEEIGELIDQEYGVR